MFQHGLCSFQNTLSLLRKVEGEEKLFIHIKVPQRSLHSFEKLYSAIKYYETIIVKLTYGLFFPLVKNTPKVVW